MKRAAREIDNTRGGDCQEEEEEEQEWDKTRRENSEKTKGNSVPKAKLILKAKHSK